MHRTFKGFLRDWSFSSTDTRLEFFSENGENFSYPLNFLRIFSHPLNFQWKFLHPLTFFSYPLLAPKKFRTPYFHLNFSYPLFSSIFSHPYSHLNIHIPLFFTERLVYKMVQRKKTLDLLYAKAAKHQVIGVS